MLRARSFKKLLSKQRDKDVVSKIVGPPRQVLDMPHLWSLILWSCLGAFEQMVTRLRVPAVAHRVNMMDRKRRLQIQLYHVIAMTCRRRVSLVVRRVFSSGLEA